MPKFGTLFRGPAASRRRDIPFFYDKSESEFREDPYERYDGLVARQTALHLADTAHGEYPFQPVLDYLFAQAGEVSSAVIVDVGCSVGRLLGEFAKRYPKADCYGIDYSYQMLRQASDHWTKGKGLSPNVLRYGMETPDIKGHVFDNLHFALAKAERLPFPDDCIDLLFSTFLLDRIGSLESGLKEFVRVLRPGGKMIAITPLNFLSADQWRKYHPPVRVFQLLEPLGLELLDWTDPLIVEEPLDGRGNHVRWKCIAWSCRYRAD